MSKTREEFKKIADELRYCQYGRVKLTDGVYTKGRDRTPTKNFIFSDSLDGKSVLDIGSAGGYMCFEAEKLGASRVLGVEYKEGYFNKSEGFKEMFDSSVDFMRADIEEVEILEKFDYILLLNIIHHWDDPKLTFKRMISLLNDGGVIIIEGPKFPALNKATRKAGRKGRKRTNFWRSNNKLTMLEFLKDFEPELDISVHTDVMYKGRPITKCFKK